MKNSMANAQKKNLKIGFPYDVAILSMHLKELKRGSWKDVSKICIIHISKTTIYSK